MPSIFSTADFNRRLSPNERRFRIAEILTKGATDTSPIQSIFQGGSRLVQALLAKSAFDDATSEAKVTDLQRSNDLAQAVRAGQGFVNPGVAPGFDATRKLPAGATDLDALPAGKQLSEADPNAMSRALIGSQDEGLQKSGLALALQQNQRKNKLTDAKTLFEQQKTLKGIAPAKAPQTFETVNNPFGFGGVFQREQETGRMTTLVKPRDTSSGGLVTLRPRGVEDASQDITIRRNDPRVNQLIETGFGQVQSPAAQVNIDQRGQTKEQEAIGAFRATQFIDLQKAAQTARIDDFSLNRVEQLVQGLDTGSLEPLSQFFKAGLKSAGVDLEAFGITNDVGAAEALQSLAVGFTLEGVQKTKGAVSNKEMEEFAKIGPSLGKSPEGISLIIEMRRTLNQRAVQVAGLARKYLKQNGTMAGFGDVLDRFHQENPLFTEQLREKIGRLQQVGATGAAGTGVQNAGGLVDPRPDLSLEEAERMARERGLNVPAR